MKLIVLVVLALAVGHHATASVVPKDALYRQRALMLRANMNEYFDTLVAQLGQFFKNNGLDPMPLPDIVQGISFKDLLGITWHGELELSQGSLGDLSLFSRSGDATINYDHKLLHIKVEIGFEQVILDYDFRAQIMNIGPKGSIEGKVKNLKLYLDIIADLQSMDIFLQDLQITDAGKLDLVVHGQGILDILIDVIADVVTLVFHNQLVGIIEKEVRTVVEKALADINLGSIVGGGNKTSVF